MIKVQINHLGLLNYSENKAKKFYADILGFKEQYRFSLSANEARSIFGIPQDIQVLVLAGEQIKLEIFIVPKGVEFNPAVNHVCLTIADRSAIAEQCRKSGFTVLELERNGKRLIFVKDEAGNIFELKEIESKN